MSLADEALPQVVELRLCAQLVKRDAQLAACQEKLAAAERERDELAATVRGLRAALDNCITFYVSDNRSKVLAALNRTPAEWLAGEETKG